MFYATVIQYADDWLLIAPLNQNNDFIDIQQSKLFKIAKDINQKFLSLNVQKSNFMVCAIPQHLLSLLLT